MSGFRITIRYGHPRQQYHIQDVMAETLHEAMRIAVEGFPEFAVATADLVEIRRQTDPEERTYGPE